jgi:hypothetical protein
MVARMTRNEAWAYFEHPLTNAQAVEKGELACIDTATGLLAVGATSLTLRPIGTFEDAVTGDAVTDVRVKLFDEIRIHWFDNDSGTPVVAADVGSLCYLLDARTVTGDATGASAAGRVWAVDATKGVAFEPIGFDSAES